MALADDFARFSDARERPEREITMAHRCPDCTLLCECRPGDGSPYRCTHCDDDHGEDRDDEDEPDEDESDDE